MRCSERLFHGLRDRLPDLAKHAFDPDIPPPIPGADPWILASLLQKAIRRGDLLMARRAGHQLLGLDPSRLWRRVMVVGLEDIGLGDCFGAVSAITLATVPQTRRLLGGNIPALDVALRLGCEATKDRTGDHFGALAREMGDETHSLKEASEAARLAVLASAYLPWRRRLRAAVLLSEIEGVAADRAAAFTPVCELFRALDVPSDLMDACAVYRFKARDPLPFFVPLATSLWLAQGAPRTTITHSLPAPCAIGELPDYAFDPLRTRLGRRAIGLWLRSYMQKPPFDGRQVAAALWNLEAAACARTLNWPLGQEIKEQAAAADLVRCGVPVGRGAELMAWIVQERSVLSCARKAVWESTLRDGAQRPSELRSAAE